MKTSFSLKALLSLILVMSGCQTLKHSLDTTATADSATTLSVARAYLEDGRPDKALYELRAYINKYPKDPAGHTLMGLTQMALKNPNKGIEHLKTAWNLEPKAQNALNLSSAYLQSKQPDIAQKIIMKGLATKETPPYPHKERFFHNLALVAQMKGKDKVAEKSLRKALEENPTFYLSRQQLALMLVKQGRVEEAREQWELARNSCPGCFEPTENLARYYQVKGDLKTALGLIVDYKRIEGINPIEAKRALELEAELNNQRSKIVKEASESKTRY